MCYGNQYSTVASTDFGESTYGKRIDYTTPKYRDPFWAVLYIIHIIVVIICSIYLWISEYSNITNNTTNNNSDPNTDETDSNEIDNWTGIIIAIIVSMIVGVLFGICWLQLIKYFASIIIKVMLFVNVILWIVVGIIGIITAQIFLAVVGFILAIFMALWMWCVWSRIPFASVLLSISSTIVSKYQGTIILSIFVILFDIAWIFIWGSLFAVYIVTRPVVTTCNDSGECINVANTNNFIIFLLLVSMYWGFQVNQNISHMTTCGVSATWYFSTSIDHKPTPAAFKRTMTTSFGSVCLGSLLVAILQAIRAMLRSVRDRNIIGFIAMCLLNCIEWAIRYFNKYAFAQCAIYGTSYIESAKATWSLFTSRGIFAIINDDLTGLTISAGAVIGGVVSAGVATGIAYTFYGAKEELIIAAIGGFVVGYILCAVILMVLASSVVALFVCYAEDPAAMYNNRNEEYNRLTEAHDKWADVY
eukprot:418346_1